MLGCLLSPQGAEQRRHKPRVTAAAPAHPPQEETAELDREALPTAPSSSPPPLVALRWSSPEKIFAVYKRRK